MAHGRRSDAPGRKTIFDPDASTHTALFVHTAALQAYHYPPDCPFKTERAQRTVELLQSMGLLDDADMVSAEAAPRDVIERFHLPAYLDMLRDAPNGDMGVEGLEMGLGTPETPVFGGMYEYAALACGATLAAVDAVTDGRARRTFNPSGGYHHAHPAKAGGFCYINDIALACDRLTEAGRRVLFLDIDVHHCDGVQDAFYDRSDVLVMSFHQTGKTLFPGTGFAGETGVGDGEGYTVNVPLPPGTYDEAYLRAFRALAPPIARAYDPDVIVFEVGMDCLSGDPLAGMTLTNNAYVDVVREVLGWGKPVAATGGGGYHQANTARGWALLWAELAERDTGESLAYGLGGVMLESTDWHGGLRDRAMAPSHPMRQAVDRVIRQTVDDVKANVFPVHGL
ncbi:MAG: acetoin utilization protein AcuC [Phycisphaerae bacterium]|nr:acetoin utilization protein AcuC [Phycisphaerae bacterium]